MEDRNTIKFYHEDDPYGFLSNYYPVDIVVDGSDWKSVEHYYQAQKTFDLAFAEEVRNAETCDEAKKLGNSERCTLRPDWDTWKNIAMKKGLEAKFSQHEDLKTQLLATEDAILMENSQKDYYWGIGAEGTGKSMLGQLLMELRAQLRSV